MAIRKKTGGRVAGTPNRTTSETKELLNKIVGKELNKLGALLEKLEPTERVNAIAKLLPYIVPKQSEIKAEIETNLSMTPEQREERLEYFKSKLNKL